jgi:hypothetical protein
MLARNNLLHYKNNVQEKKLLFFPPQITWKKTGKPTCNDYEQCQKFIQASTFIIFHLFLLAPVPEPRAPFFSIGPEPTFPLPADVFLALEFPVPFRSNFTSTPTA